MLTSYYAEESSDSSVVYSNIECHDLKISADSLKIVVKGKNIPQDSELVIYGNRQDKIENLASYDDDMQISGKYFMYCSLKEERKFVQIFCGD